MVGIHRRPEQFAVETDAANGDAAEIDAVIALVAADEAGFAGMAFERPIGAGDLQCRINSFRPGIGEENMIEPGGSELHQAVGQLERQRMAELESRRIIQFRKLAADGVDDLAPGMAGTAGPKARQAVENASPIHIEVIHALARLQQAWIVLELAVAGKRHPMRFELRPVQFHKPHLISRSMAGRHRAPEAAPAVNRVRRGIAVPANPKAKARSPPIPPARRTETRAASFPAR